MEQSDALGLTGSAGMGGAFSLGTRFSTGSSKTMWHTLPVGAATTTSVGRYAAGWLGDGGPKGPGGDSGRLLAP